MDTKVTPIKDKSQVELDISASKEEFQAFLDKAAKHISSHKPLKGFRPGKAPLSVVIEAFGQDHVVSEAVDSAIPHFFIQAITEHDIEALGRPAVSISKASLDEGLQFVATVDVMPEVKLGDLKKLSAERHRVEIDDKTVDDELKYLAKMRSTSLEVARPAQEGDTVVIDFKVSREGQVIEGGESKNHPVQIGEGHFVPGFEDKIKGMSAGETREFNLTFPEDFSKEEFRGKEMNVWVHAHSIQKQVVPEVNDEFAKKIGKFTDLNNLKEELRKNMQLDHEHKEEDRLHGELAEKLAEQATFGPIPDTLIEREIDHRLNEFSQMLAMQNKTVDDYLQKEQKTLQQMRDDMRESAEKSVKVGLALRTFAQQNNITPEEKDVEERVQQFLSQFSSSEEAKQSVDEEELRTYVTSQLRNHKALHQLEEIANITKAKDESDKK